MTEKRFKLDSEVGFIDTQQCGGDTMTLFEVVVELNKLNEENEQLWNKKERYKRLSEIRQQEINNRILTIKEFINNCSDNKVRSVLKELFYSEVNEYDLSSENRKLLNENEQLKQNCKNYNWYKQYKTLLNENEQLKAQLYCDSNEGVCSICKHHYLENGSLYYISKCEKGHEKCSKESVRHCEDFELKELEND